MVRFALTVSLLHHGFVMHFQTKINTSEENGSEQRQRLLHFFCRFNRPGWLISGILWLVTD